MSETPMGILAGLMIKPAIRKFVTEHRNVYATFRFEGKTQNIRVEMFDCDLSANLLPSGDPLVSAVITPEQQYQMCVEFMKVAADRKGNPK